MFKKNNTKINEIKNTKDDANNHGQTLFAWVFSEFPQYERSKSWYIWAGIIIGLSLVYSILTLNFLFAIIIVITSLLVTIFRRTSNEVEFKITEDGILVNKVFYDYDDIKNFFVIYQPPEVKTLFFEPKSVLKPRIPVSLEEQNPVKIREALLEYLDEDLDRENEPTSEQFSRMFKL